MVQKGAGLTSLWIFTVSYGSRCPVVLLKSWPVTSFYLFQGSLKPVWTLLVVSEWMKVWVRVMSESMVSSHLQHAVLSHCLLCLLVTVTPGYFCCRGIYSSVSILHFSLSICSHFNPQLSVYICVSGYNRYALCVGVCVSVVCVPLVFVTLFSLTSAGSGQTLVGIMTDYSQVYTQFYLMYVKMDNRC